MYFLNMSFESTKGIKSFKLLSDPSWKKILTTFDWEEVQFPLPFQIIEIESGNQ